VNSSEPRGQGGFALSLAVEMAALDQGRLALLSYLAPFALDERVINRVEVVLEEMVSNVVRHSADADRLTIEAECTDRTVRLTVEDDGSAFNPLNKPEPARFSTLEDAPVGGQGIPLIKRLSKSVRYERVGALNRISALIGSP
jgi:anti-sigma regulatory factor (Ser/Thr protein kinase)